MNFSGVNAGLGLMSLLANVITVVIVVAFVTTRFSTQSADRWESLRDQLAPAALAVAWIVGVFCTSGSLFLQFGEHLDPCDFCWFQRICMYPQAVLLAIAVITGDKYMVKRYMIPLAAIGSVISVIHIELHNIQSWFGWSSVPGCSLNNPCTFHPITEFGFITIPYMALSGFLLIITLLSFVREARADGDSQIVDQNAPATA
jgi:disulfide bond formation protein DsbB